MRSEMQQSCEPPNYLIFCNQYLHRSHHAHSKKQFTGAQMHSIKRYQTTQKQTHEGCTVHTADNAQNVAH